MKSAENIIADYATRDRDAPGESWAEGLIATLREAGYIITPVPLPGDTISRSGHIVRRDAA